MKYFQGAYGCIDGSHFPIEVRSNEKDNWRNRKGFISTNSLLITDVKNNLLFTYAMFGAEGCGGDSVVLRYASANYLGWLADGSFDLLTPYRGVRYHLKEFSEAASHKQKKNYSIYVTQLSGRAIGVLKKRFRILREPSIMGNRTLWETFYS